MHKNSFGLIRMLAIVGIAIALSVASGCKSDSSTASGSSGSSGGSGGSGGGSSARTTKNVPTVLTEAEKTQVIGPAAAREFNYRVDWQYPDAGRNLKHLSVQGDSVFSLDEQNYLTRIRIEDGNRLWRIQAAEEVEVILGVTFVPGRVYVTTGSAMLVLDASTGSQIGKQPLDTIASTAPVVFGSHLIYGSRNGQLVWHSGPIGYQSHGYQISHSIKIPPVLWDRYVVAVGANGTVMVLGADTARQYWSKTLLDRIDAPPAVGEGAVYVAGLDQYLWAFDLVTGRNIWKVLTEGPLTEPPSLIEGRVYQQVPHQGLVCFNAQPVDSPGGEQIWASPNAKGNVLSVQRSELFVWNPPEKQLTLVDAARGSMIKTIDLPKADRLIVAGANNQDIYAASKDGRIVRLVPRT